MKKMTTIMSMLLMIVMLAAPGAYADSINVGDTIRLEDSDGYSPGGAFSLYKGSIYQFETFCMEANEYFDFSTEVLTVTGVTKEARKGGSGGSVNGMDPLDARTAFLYYNYRMNTLPSLVGGFSYANSPSATALQQAIWYIEQETTTPLSGLALNLYNAANTAPTTSLTTAYNSVAVLNLARANGEDGQDTLTLTSVPEPATMLLLGLGLIGLAGVRGRCKN